LSKVLADEKYVDANAEEGDDYDDEEEQGDGGEKDQGGQFWEKLEIPNYENKT